MKKRHVFYIAIAIALIVSNIIVIPIIASKGMFITQEETFTIVNYIRWEFTVFPILMIFLCVVMSHKFLAGKIQEVLFVVASVLIISIIFSYLILALIDCGFDFTVIDWFGTFDTMVINGFFYLILLLVFFGLFALYCMFINKNFISILGFDSKLKQVKESN